MSTIYVVTDRGEEIPLGYQHLVHYGLEHGFTKERVRDFLLDILEQNRGLLTRTQMTTQAQFLLLEENACLALAAYWLEEGESGEA